MPLSFRQHAVSKFTSVTFKSWSEIVMINSSILKTIFGWILTYEYVVERDIIVHDTVRMQFLISPNDAIFLARR